MTDQQPNDMQAPDQKFVDRLAWELDSTVRRRKTLNGVDPLRRFRYQWAAAFALAAVSMCIGGAGTYAAIRLPDSQAADLYAARAATLLEIARTQLEHHHREYSRMRALVDRGSAPQRELRRFETQQQQAEMEVAVRQLELEETRLTGKEPNDALSAPRVAGRDFVTERLEMRRRAVRIRLELVHNDADHAQSLIEAGMASSAELLASRAELIAIESELEAIERRRALRAEFLAGTLSAATVELREMRFGAIAARQQARGRLEVVIAQHDRLSRLAERGLVNDAELSAVQAELQTVEAHVQLADLELRILDQKLQEMPAP